MKLYNILTVSALSLILAGAAGCTKEVDYEPAIAPTGAQIFFATTATSSFDLAEGQNSVTVDVSRLSKSGAASANIKATATVGTQATDIFNIPSSVSFADGSETAPITITFDFDKIVAETTYSISLELEGEGLSTYGKTVQNISILYAPWSEWSKMDGDVYWTTAFYGGTYDYPIYERQSLLNPSLVQYQIPELIEEDHNLVININTATNAVTVEPFDTGDPYDASANIWMCDSYTYYTTVLPKDFADDYKDASHFDSETGAITVNMVYYVPGVGSWGTGYFDTFQLPGYPDYNVSMSNAGTYISEAGQEYSILSVVKGNDVASYAITLKQGYLSDGEVQEEVDAMIANSETILYNENRDFQFPMYEEDYYTCITVSYDAAGEAKGSNSYIFYNELNSVDWNEGWTTVTKNAEFNDVFFAGLWWSDVYGWEVEVQESDDQPGYYRIVKPYANNIYDEPVERGHYYVYIDATDPDNVVVDESLTSYGYYVMSVDSGKLVDGNKFVFPGNSLGVWYGYNDDGSMLVYAEWPEEATLLDLDPQAEEAEPEAVKARKAKAQKLNKASKPNTGVLMPYTGKKIEKQFHKLGESRR